MRFEGRFRARCIRTLVLVLALTASRSNFPLSSSSGAAPSSLGSRVSGTPKKYEGVTPSRRNIESRRAARDQSRDAEVLPKSLVKGIAEELFGLAGVLPSCSEHGHSIGIGVTTPPYLQPFLLNSPASSLPPPV